MSRRNHPAALLAAMSPRAGAVMPIWRLAVIALTCSLLAATALRAAAQSPAARLAIQVCASCHGRGGRSISPTFPRLAGQPAQYIEAQLNAFKQQTRKDPDAQAYMWGMAAQLDEPTIKALAEYYAAEQPAPGTKGDAQRASAGRQIYDNGIAAEGVPACATCHGASGQGQGQFPRLAGQHAAYQVKQLRAFRSGLRESPVMGPIAGKLSDREMDDVATYMASQ